MGASERLSLLLETKTVGEAEVDKLGQAINRVLNMAERSSKAGAGGNDFAAQFRGIKDAIQNPLNAASEAAEGFIGKYGKIGLVAGTVAVGVGAASTAMFTLVKNTGAAAGAIVDLSDRLNISVRDAARLSGAAQIAGVNIESLEGAARILGATLEDASGAGEKVHAALQKVGVSSYTAQGAQREYGAIILDVLKALSKYESATERIARAQQLLPKGASIGLIPLIKDYNELLKTIDKIGVAQDENLINRLDKASDQIATLGVAWDGFRAKLAGVIEPIAVPIIVKITEFLGDFDLASVGAGFAGGRGAAAILSGRGRGGSTVRGLERVNGSTGFTAAEAARRESQALSNRFRQSFGSTLEGATAYKGVLGGEISSLRQQLMSGDLSAEVFRQKEAEYFRKIAEQESLDSRIDILQNAQKPFTATIPQGSGFRATPSLLTGRNRILAGSLGADASRFGYTTLPDGSLMIPQSSLVDGGGADMGRKRAELDAAADAARSERQRELQRDELDHRIRMIELLAGPGGEMKAIEQITTLRISAAQTEQEIRQAMWDGEIRILELQAARRRELREGDGRLFDALVGGGAGIRSWASSLGMSSGRTIFQNLNEMGRTSLGSRLQIPGQTRADGSLNFLGQALRMSPFGVNEADQKQVTAANIQMAAAQIQLQAAGGSTGSISAIASSLGLPGGVFQGASGGNPMILSNRATVSTSGRQRVPIFNELGEIEGYTQNKLSTGQKIGIAGAAAGGAFGVYSGIQQGGIRGATTATGSAAGAAAAILTIAGFTGPAAPILAGVALGASLITGLLPDPKRQREGRIDSTLDAARYVSPSAMNYETTTYGGGFDYGKGGNLRPIIVEQHFNLIDATSIYDRRRVFSEAVRQDLLEDSPLSTEIRQLSSRA